MWLDLDLIKTMVKFSRNLFPTVAYAYGSTPTYPGGVNGFLICSLDKVSLSELR
jgi:spermidine synthase